MAQSLPLGQSLASVPYPHLLAGILEQILTSLGSVSHFCRRMAKENEIPYGKQLAQRAQWCSHYVCWEMWHLQELPFLTPCSPPPLPAFSCYQGLSKSVSSHLSPCPTVGLYCSQDQVWLSASAARSPVLKCLTPRRSILQPHSPDISQSPQLLWIFVSYRLLFLRLTMPSSSSPS